MLNDFFTTLGHVFRGLPDPDFYSIEFSSFQRLTTDRSGLLLSFYLVLHRLAFFKVSFTITSYDKNEVIIKNKYINVLFMP